MVSSIATKLSQFNINYLFTQLVCFFYPKVGSYPSCYSWSECTWLIWQWSCSQHSPNLQGWWLTNRWFNAISKTFVSGCLNPLQRFNCRVLWLLLTKLFIFLLLPHHYMHFSTIIRTRTTFSRLPSISVWVMRTWLVYLKFIQHMLTKYLPVSRITVVCWREDYSVHGRYRSLNFNIRRHTLQIYLDDSTWFPLEHWACAVNQLLFQGSLAIINRSYGLNWDSSMILTVDSRQSECHFEFAFRASFVRRCVL